MNNSGFAVGPPAENGACHMVTGKVKKIILDRGYGFIDSVEGCQDIFFHHSGLVGVRMADLELGQGVTFELSQGPDRKGPRATNIRVE